MSEGLLPIVVPAMTDVLLLVACLGVWTRLRRLRMGRVGEWTLTAVMVDAAAQVWHLLSHQGNAAGVAWLIHVSLSYMIVYVLYRLGQLLWRLQAGGVVMDEIAGCITRGGGAVE